MTCGRVLFGPLYGSLTRLLGKFYLSTSYLVLFMPYPIFKILNAGIAQGARNIDKRPKNLICGHCQIFLLFT